jgi:hypothetical protein
MLTILTEGQKLAHPTLHLTAVASSLSFFLLFLFFFLWNPLEYGICSYNLDNRSTTEGALAAATYQLIGAFRTSAHMATSTRAQ